MALSLVPVTGRIVLPNDTAYTGGILDFTLSSTDTELQQALPTGTLSVTLTGTDIPAAFQLWRNTSGVAGSNYKVQLRATVEVNPLIPGTTIRKTFLLGYIQVGVAASYTIGALLANPVSPTSSWNLNIQDAATGRTALGLGALAVQNTVNLSTQATGTMQAAQEPAHTGDVTNTAGSLAMTIAPDAVTFSKLLNSTAASVLIGRGSASGAGDFQEVTLGTNLSMSGTTLNAAVAPSDGDKGDITVSGSGAVWTIDNGAVTLAKQANVATGTVFYRTTVGAGIPEVQTLATLKADLGLAGANSGDQTITLTGPITGSGTGSFATTITAGVVTLAMQANMATGSLVYRKTAAAGAPEVQTLATLKTDLGLTGTNSGDQTITLTGPVTGSGTGSFATAITAGAVTLAMQSDVATARIMGRTTAGTGVQEALTAAQAKTVLAIASADVSGLGALATLSTVNLSTQATGTLQAAQAPVYSGDVSTSGLTTTILADAVTNTKLANVATATIKGRVTAGTGDPEDLTATQAKAVLNIAVGDISGLGPFATASTVSLSTQATGVLQPAQEPAHTGDVTNSAGSLAMTIAAGVVSNAKLATVPTATLKGRTTAGTGAPEDMTVAQAKAMLAYVGADVGMSGGGTAQDYAGFATRAAFVTWASGKTPATGAIINAGGFAYRYIASGTAISDLPGYVPLGDIWLDHWGPDLTGATDDNAKLTAFFTYISGKSGNLPAGIINWTQQSGAIGVMATGTIVRGQGIGVTILRMNVPSTAFARAFQWQNPRIVMRDFTFIFPTLSNCAPSFANLSAGDGMLERVRFEGGVTGSPTASHTAIVMNGSTTANFSNFTFKDCEFDKVSEALEKGNTATAIHKNFKFVDCRFSDCHSLGLSLNSPAGDMDGVIISNLIAENTTAHGATNMAIGVATGHNISVLGAVIKGPWWVAVHLEQNVRNASFVGITAEIDGDFFDCTSNNIGGTWYRPEQVSLTGFAAEKTGTRGTSVGIRLTFDGNTISSADSIVISNGVLKNFATGVRVGTRADDDVRISNLDIINCDTGIYYTADGFLDAKEITFKGCTTAVLAAKGGILEGPTFSNCTNTHTVTAGALEMVDPKFNLGSQVFTAAQTRFFHLLRNVTRATSKVSLRAYNTGTHRHTVLYQMDWDGTTETATSIHSMTGGGTITCLPAWVDGALTVAVTAGGTGYTAGDVLSVAGGTLESTGNRTTATVATVSSGVVTAVTLTTYGEWATPPANAAATTGGTGTGCTLTLTYGKTLCAKVFDSAAHTDFIEVAVSGSIFVQ